MLTAAGTASASLTRLAARTFEAAAALTLAAVAIGLPAAFHLIGLPAGVAICASLGILLAVFAPAQLPVVLIFSFVFQNAFVALVSPNLPDIAALNAARGYNFLLTTTAWATLSAIYWTSSESYPRQFRMMMTVTTAILVCIFVYFAIGAMGDFGNAAIYLRNIVTPVFLFQVFALVFQRNRVAMEGPLVVIAAIAVLFGYLELFAHDSLFGAINGDVYLAKRASEAYAAGNWVKELEATGFVFRSYLDTLRIALFNSPLFSDLGIELQRLVGPNFHSISFAYALAFFMLVLLAIGHWWYALLALPLLIAIGSKGALVLIVLVVAASALSRHLPKRILLWSYVALLVAYACTGIVIGIRMQDYHVIGLIGGVKGFLSNPIGRGIGAGGNLSVDPAAINWTQSQHLGETNVAVESAVGVLLNQMGVFGIAVIAVLIWIAVKVWMLHMRTGDRLTATCALGLLTIVVNGIFQEEALFAPLAAGLFAALAGLLLGRAGRPAVHEVQRARSPQ